tara:strand:- start:340 stop:633 length:294 start_codon:yes stop_codon:yes gene_type:complete
MKKKESNKLKSFYIKLISITFAIIVVINVIFNLISEKLDYLNKIIALTELEERRDLANNLRKKLNESLNDDVLIKKDDRILLKKIYKKLQAEFQNLD